VAGPLRRPTPSDTAGTLCTEPVAAVKNAAKAALIKVFEGLAAKVLPIGVDNRFEDSGERVTNMVEVSGGYYCVEPGACPCGLTGSNRAASTAWYECNMGQAQYALNLQSTDLSDMTSSPEFAHVPWATGEGIGNTSAHEIAHQLLDVACGMNDDMSKVGVYDGGSADAGNDPSVYTGVGPGGVAIHWSPNTRACLQKKILGGK
jgi:hypothetical protein